MGTPPPPRQPTFVPASIPLASYGSDNCNEDEYTIMEQKYINDT